MTESGHGYPAYEEDGDVYGYDRVVYFRLLAILGEANTGSSRKPDLSEYDGETEE